MWLGTCRHGPEDYKLETVAQACWRGERNRRAAGETKTAAIMRLYREEPENLCLYCLEDTRLAMDIVQKEGLDRYRRPQDPFDRHLIGAEHPSVWLHSSSSYSEHLHERGLVAPTLGIDQDVLDKAPGAVSSHRAPVYRNVLAFDFKSLYPSLMRTFNIDPVTRILAAREPRGQPRRDHGAQRRALHPVRRRATPRHFPNSCLSTLAEITLQRSARLSGSRCCRNQSVSFPSHALIPATD